MLDYAEDAGLLSTTSVASSVPRVQSVDVRQGLIQRLVALCDVELKNIGEADFSVPGCDEQQAELLRDLALDGSDGVRDLTRKLSPLAVFKATAIPRLCFVPLAIGLWFVLGWWSLLFLLFIPLDMVVDQTKHPAESMGNCTGRGWTNNETFAWNRTEALLRKTNSVSITQSLFERKRGLATVHVKVRGRLDSIRWRVDRHDFD